MRAGFDGGRGMGFSGKKFEADVEGIEVIATKCSFENAANLIVVAGGFEFFRGAANGKIVDHDLTLLEGAMGNAAEFAEFEITEVLHTDPYADADDGSTRPSELPVGQSRNRLSRRTRRRRRRAQSQPGDG